MNSRNSRLNKRPLVKRKGFWLSLLIPLLILAGVIYYYWFRVENFVKGIHDNTSTNSSTVSWTGTDRVNILLFGVDNRGGDPHPRTDVNLLVSIDPKTHTAEMFSILRDTWYKIPGYNSQKINAAYSLGGPDLAVKTFSDFLQIPINYYAVTDFQGFEKVVDAVGGIDLDVEKNMDYVDDGVYDIHLKKGFQHLDGQHALEYVRFRHDAMGDFWRTERQRKFLKALAEQMKKPSSVLKFPSILDAIQPYVKTNMTMDDMLKLGMLAKDVDWSNLKSQQLPDMKNLKTGIIDGEDSVIPDVYATRVLVHQMLGMDDTIEKDPSVEYNGPVNSSESGANLQQSAPSSQSPDVQTAKPQTTTPPTNPFDGSNSKDTTKSSGVTNKTSTESAPPEGLGAASQTKGSATDQTSQGTGSVQGTGTGNNGNTGSTAAGTGSNTSQASSGSAGQSGTGNTTTKTGSVGSEGGNTTQTNPSAGTSSNGSSTGTVSPGVKQ